MVNPILKQSKIFPIIRFSTIIVISCLCEKGTCVHISKNQKSGNGILSGLQISKIVSKLFKCINKSLENYCKLCGIETGTVLAVLNSFDIKGAKSTDEAIARVLLNDFKRIVSLLEKNELDVATRDRVTSFLYALYSGSLSMLFENYINLIKHLIPENRVVDNTPAGGYSSWSLGGSRLLADADEDKTTS